jgi:hypothetical protein
VQHVKKVLSHHGVRSRDDELPVDGTKIGIVFFRWVRDELRVVCRTHELDESLKTLDRYESLERRVVLQKVYLLRDVVTFPYHTKTRQGRQVALARVFGGILSRPRP